MSESLTVDINRLVLGRQLTFPVHSETGILLLGTSEVLTAELRSRLLARGINQVVINNDDAGMLTPLESDDPVAIEELETSLNARIEEFAREGQTRVRNTGPAVRDSVRRHGLNDYSDVHRQAAQKRHQASINLVDELMQAVKTGRRLDARALDQVVGNSLELISSDFGCALTTVLASLGAHDLAVHSAKMSTLGMAIGIEMGFDLDNVRMIGVAGLLSDLGMLQVPPEILSITRRLTAAEQIEIQKHCIRSVNLIERMGGLSPLIGMIVYQIHECPDGTGYPRGRTLKFIHPFARILSVADGFAAMTSDRADRPRLMAYEAMKTLLNQAKRQKVDAEVVRALLRCVSLFPIGSYVLLNDGSTGRVLRATGDEYTKPIVRRLLRSTGELIDGREVDAIVNLTVSDYEIVKALPDPSRTESMFDPRLSVAATA